MIAQHSSNSTPNSVSKQHLHQHQTAYPPCRVNLAKMRPRRHPEKGAAWARCGIQASLFRVPETAKHASNPNQVAKHGWQQPL